MNGKWWRYAIVGVLLLDLCLFVAGTIHPADVGVLALPWADGLMLQKVSLTGYLVKGHLMENLTVAAAVLLTVSLL